MKHRIRIKNTIAYLLIALAGLISALLILRAYAAIGYIEEDSRLEEAAYQRTYAP